MVGFIAMVLSILGEWVLTTAAGEVLKGVQTQLQTSDLETVLKNSTAYALDAVPELFWSCQKDSYKGFKVFLEQYFQDIEVKPELQKPLQDKGKPSVNTLSVALGKNADDHANLKDDYNPEFVEPWIQAFVESYFDYIQGSRFKAARSEYLKQLSQRVDDIKFIGIAVAGEEVEKQEQLAQIFVMPTVLEEQKATVSRPFVLVDTPGLPMEAQLAMDALQSGGDDQARLLEEQRLWAKRDQSGRKLPAQQVLKQSRNKAVLLGAPGSGKTTLVSYFALMLGEQDSSDPTQIGLDAKEEWLPLVVRIRDWALQPTLGLLAYLRWFAKESLSVQQLPQGFFEHWLEQGRALVLLDGLDEVVNEGQRRKIVEQIETFWGQYSSNPGVITSRPAGYRWDFFDLDAFPHYTLDPFDDQQITTFIDHWYSSREPDPGKAERRKADLDRAFKANDRIKLLAKNPLLLTIIVLIHRYQAELPRQRFRLYEKAVETLLTTWDSAREIRLYEQVLTFLKPDDLLYVLKKLAYWVHTQGQTGDSEGGTLIHIDELCRQLGGQIKVLKNCQSHEAKGEAERFIDFIKQRTGLLNEQGRDCYAFVHKTFQEYLTAEEIYDRYDWGDDDIIQKHIEAHLHEQHWREVLLLLVSKLKGRRAAEAICYVYQTDSEYEQWLKRDLLFSGWCLAEDPQGVASADNALIHNILNDLVALEVSDPETTGSAIRDEGANILHRFGETAVEVDARTKLLEQSEHINQFRLLAFQASLGQEQEQLATLLGLIKDESSSVRSRAAAALVNLGQGSAEVVNGLLGLIKDESSDVRSRAAAALVNLGQGSAEVVNGLLGLIKDESSDVRSRAAESLGNLGQGSAEVVNGLLGLIKDESSDVRSRAAAALGNLGQGSAEVVNGLLGLIKDESSDVRSRAAAALVNLGQGSAEVVNGLLGLIKDESSDVRSRAAAALVNLGQGSAEVVNGLLGLIKDESSDVRSRAAAALGNLGQGSAEVVNGLLGLIKDESSDVRSRAAAALGNLGQGSAEVVNGLLGLIKDESSSVRSRAAAALVNLGQGSAEVVNGLLGLIKDESSDVRSRAAAALVNLGQGSAEVVNGLLGLIKDESSDVRSRAAAALVNLGQGSAEVVNGLLGLIKDESSDVRSRAAAALGNLGQGSAEVVNGLLGLIKDESSYVRYRAAESLVNLGGKDETIVLRIEQWLSQESDQRGRIINILSRICVK